MTTDNTPTLNGSPTSPDFEAVANDYLGDYGNSTIVPSPEHRSIQVARTKRIIEWLYNSPEALEALGLMKSLDAVAMSLEMHLNAENCLSDDCLDKVNKLEAELKAVREMRDRLVVAMKKHWYSGYNNNDWTDYPESFYAADAQKAKEAKHIGRKLIDSDTIL